MNRKKYKKNDEKHKRKEEGKRDDRHLFLINEFFDLALFDSKSDGVPQNVKKVKKVWMRKQKKIQEKNCFVVSLKRKFYSYSEITSSSFLHKAKLETVSN